MSRIKIGTDRSSSVATSTSAKVKQIINIPSVPFEVGVAGMYSEKFLPEFRRLYNRILNKENGDVYSALRVALNTCIDGNNREGSSTKNYVMVGGSDNDAISYDFTGMDEFEYNEIKSRFYDMMVFILELVSLLRNKKIYERGRVYNDFKELLAKYAEVTECGKDRIQRLEAMNTSGTFGEHCLRVVNNWEDYAWDLNSKEKYFGTVDKGTEITFGVDCEEGLEIYPMYVSCAFCFNGINHYRYKLFHILHLANGEQDYKFDIETDKAIYTLDNLGGMVNFRPSPKECSIREHKDRKHLVLGAFTEDGEERTAYPEYCLEIVTGGGFIY